MSRVIKYLNVHLPYGPFLSHGSKVLSVNRPRPFLRHVPYSLWTYRKKLMDRHSIGKKGSIRPDMFALESRPTECKIASCNRPSMIAIGGLLHFVCSSAFGSHARRRRTFFLTARSGGPDLLYPGTAELSLLGACRPCLGRGLGKARGRAHVEDPHGLDETKDHLQCGPFFTYAYSIFSIYRRAMSCKRCQRA